jgi:hypothetical protein
MNRTFQQVYNIPGTLAASHVFAFKAHADLQLIHVSLSNSTANAGTLKIGRSGDDDAYLTATAFGVSSAPAEVAEFSGFGGADAASQFPHIPDGTVVLVTITDHASHMANVCVALTFTEG